MWRLKPYGSVYSNELRGDERKLNELERTKSEVAAQRADALLRFGPHVRTVLQLIEENAHRFKQRPLGPLGKHFLR